jgi:hypothetical protein
VCEVNLPTTFRKPLWVPSSLVMSLNVNEQRSGVLPHIGVEGVWMGSAALLFIFLHELQTVILYAFSPPPIRATCPAHLIPFDLICQKISVQQHRSHA